MILHAVIAPACAADAAHRSPLVVAPTVEGMYVCPSATADMQRVASHVQAAQECSRRGETGSAAVNALLDTLEPGGPKGDVQVGFTLTLQLLGLYRKTDSGWKINDDHVNASLQLIREIKRPVVIYLAADHFDTVGPLAEELGKDPRNLMWLSDGTPPQLGYFGYTILPYTLSTDPSIPVNMYRYAALEYIASKLQTLPKEAQERIVAVNLVGELHHMFPDFENGMGLKQDMRVTDYSPASVAGFKTWLRAKYGTVETLSRRMGLQFASFEEVPAPTKDIRKDKLQSFGEHYDAYADGVLPIGGWLWDPKGAVKRLDLYVDGKQAGTVSQQLNRLDVYRAVEEITSANTGYRIDYDYSGLRPGKHIAQIVAISDDKRKSLLGEREFVVVPRDQSTIGSRAPAGLRNLAPTEKTLPGIRTYMDMPKPLQDLYFNPLARDWNEYRATQVYGFLEDFHARALKAGIPADKLYSHQIVPNVNSSWNQQLFASDTTLRGSTPWKQGLNMYGGSTDSPWMKFFIAQRKIHDYGVPEFNPQQWKLDGVHLAAMQAQKHAGARFISPYYFSVIPQRFKAATEHGVNRMELGPDNPKDGSDKFYRAIIEFARQ
ncbi:beta-galactosidase [Diaphorobacter sp. NR2-3-3-1]|nr:beta-galactosidase [Diaphorobacter caeni]